MFTRSRYIMDGFDDTRASKVPVLNLIEFQSSGQKCKHCILRALSELRTSVRHMISKEKLSGQS
jgi:hypothetical protein